MTRRRFYYFVPVLAVLVVPMLMACGAEEEEPTPRPGTKPVPATPPPLATPATPAGPKQYDAPPPMTIDPSKGYTATFQMEKGLFQPSSIGFGAAVRRRSSPASCCSILSMQSSAASPLSFKRSVDEPAPQATGTHLSMNAMTVRIASTGY